MEVTVEERSLSAPRWSRLPLSRLSQTVSHKYTRLTLLFPSAKFQMDKSKDTQLLAAADLQLHPLAKSAMVKYSTSLLPQRPLRSLPQLPELRSLLVLQLRSFQTVSHRDRDLKLLLPVLVPLRSRRLRLLPPRFQLTVLHSSLATLR
jgi:hypothetical protein